MKVKLLTPYQGANRAYDEGTIVDMPSKLALGLVEKGEAVSVDVHAEAVAFDVGAPEVREEAGLPAQPEGSTRRKSRR